MRTYLFLSQYFHAAAKSNTAKIYVMPFYVGLRSTSLPRRRRRVFRRESGRR